MTNPSAKVHQKVASLCCAHMKRYDYDTWAKFYEQACKLYNYEKKYRSSLDQINEIKKNALKSTWEG